MPEEHPLGLVWGRTLPGKNAWQGIPEEICVR